MLAQPLFSFLQAEQCATWRQHDARSRLLGSGLAKDLFALSQHVLKQYREACSQSNFHQPYLPINMATKLLARLFDAVHQHRRM